MDIGIFIGSLTHPVTLEQQVEMVAEAERDGFDSFWSAQILGVDALTLLAVAGQRTKRIKLGTGVVPTFPRHPLVMAQQAMTVQAACRGRLTLGIGLAHKPTLEGRFGIPFERTTLHMQEYLTVLRALVHDGTADFDGQAFRVHAALQVPDISPLPIVVAALGPQMLRLAGELSEGTVTWMTGRKALATHIVPRITAAAKAAGRPAPRVCVGVPIGVSDNPAAARERAAKAFQRYGLLPSYRRMLDMEGAKGPEDAAVVGNEAAVERQLRALADAGATELLASIFPVGDDAEASIARTRALLKSLVGKI